MNLQSKIRISPTRPDSLLVKLTGRLDSETAPVLEAKLLPALEHPHTSVTFDLAGLTFISSAGIRTLILVQKKMRPRGGHVYMTHMQPQIEKVFEVIKALPGFQVFANDQEMDDYLASIQKNCLEPNT